MKAWGFKYKTNIVWYKIRKDGGPDERGVGFYFRNVTELLLFGVKGSLRTGKAGRTQVNIVLTRKQNIHENPLRSTTLLNGAVLHPIWKCSLDNEFRTGNNGEIRSTPMRRTDPTIQHTKGQELAS